MRGIITLTFLTLFCIASGIAQSNSNPSTQTLAANEIDWQVYPNPFYNTFTVSSQHKDLEVKVYTLDGKLQSAAIFRHHDGTKIQYQTGLELRPGIYLVMVGKGQTFRCYKMMKI